ncbi:MAG: N-6 DNA methylase, partial [Youngiibacter sp.]|nr:N-6 DNA methylase [Youngiibacter sp.]
MQIPDYIFSNRSKSGTGKEEGILDIFDTFNFTMNEDEPLEKEVAVDPEMLGKIFEELLDVSDRKSKGAFYTPRDIVHFMCQESMTTYLANELKLPHQDIKEFIIYGDIIREYDINVLSVRDHLVKKTIYDNIHLIDKAVDKVKIADPAVGSGAFPLGMLNEIVRIKSNITEYLVKKNNSPEGIIGDGKKYPESVIRERRSHYQIKWNVIKNSIFAVDIEPSAVDITKLRLWLSVVVDQQIDMQNRDPHPLPNLDMNIHVGNSLIDDYEGIELFDFSFLSNSDLAFKGKNSKAEQLKMFFDPDEILKEIFEKQSLYFDEVNTNNKITLKNHIEDLKNMLVEYKLNQFGNFLALEKYKKIKKMKSKPFFIWELEFAKVFKEKGGFDIVIGNPPYVGDKNHKNIFRPIINSKFGGKFYKGQMDLFYFFFHKGIDLVKDNGIVGFITTNYYFTANGAMKLRYDIKERCIIRSIVNFGEMKIFESAMGQHNAITFLERSNSIENDAFVIQTKRKGFFDSSIINNVLFGLDDQTDYRLISQNEIFDGDNNYIRLYSSTRNDGVESSILNKISSQGELLGDICLVNAGIGVTVAKLNNKYVTKYVNQNYSNRDGVFVVSEQEAKYLEPQKIKDFVKNSNISNYKYVLNDDKLIYMTWDDNIEEYPHIKKHLSRYRAILEDQIIAYDEEFPWFALNRPRTPDIFECSDKIVLPYRAKRNYFAYSNSPLYASRDVLFIRSNNNKVSIKYLLALLNSKLFYYWLYNKGKRKGEILEMVATPISEIPIKFFKDSIEKYLIEIVDTILETNDNETIFNKMEEIDQILYEIYDLTKLEQESVELLYKG